MAAEPALSSTPVAGVPSGVRHRVVLVGNPNTGKTTLFNQLCGARAKTLNFPGTTTALRTGTVRRPSGETLDLIDMPGIYDLTLDSVEARIVRSAMALATA